ncbi:MULTISPECIES: hypothetical protein [Enterobacter cloacae complex]|uniref:hypothetical protein n=1 Tax=Enterobacter cloacae complex sp. GF14B TaxID=2511982 RepID=UPI002104FB21|nr:hypothetical protein [Enterobacter cloacae complex sp. GF14B]MCW4920103.1 hypothetical protein [Enterobacter hormaechei subsp. xiangfangensis]MCW4929386.1 hypothetical protein [Enterobacter hormaechei subsp. xiangfangensis]
MTGRDQRWQHSSRCPNIFYALLVVCGLAWQGAGIFNLPFTVMLWTIIRLIIVVSLVFITGKFGLSREFTFPAAAVGLAFSLFPVLDHIALGYSAKNFYETTNFMGQTVREFGASKITVWWGSIYAKIAYASLAGLIGYGVKVATDD